MPHASDNHRDVIELRLTELSRRQHLQDVLRRLSPLLFGGLLLAMAVIMIVRVAIPTWAPSVGWLALAGLLLPCAFVPLTRARRSSQNQLAGQIDRLGGANGLVMALAEQPPSERDSAWVARATRALEALSWPALDFRPLRLGAIALVGVVVAVLLPQRTPEAVAPTPPWQSHFEPIAERLSGLEATPLIPPAERDRMERQLEKLERQAERDGMSQSVWNGLDRVDQQIDKALLDTESRLAEALTAAKTASEPRLGDPPPQTDAPFNPEDMPEAERRRRDRDRLRKKPDPTTPENAEAQQHASKRLLERLTRKRAAERLSKLAKALGDLSEQAPGLMRPQRDLSPKAQAALEKLLKRAAEQGLLDEAAQEAARRLQKQMGGAPEGQEGQEGQGAGGQLSDADIETLLEELEKALEEGRLQLGGRGGSALGGASMEAALARLQAGARAGSGGNGPNGPGGSLGAGGISRGPGHAPLSRGPDPTVDIGAIGALPPGALRNPDGSITLGETERAPELDAAALKALARGQLHGHDPANADARRARISPRHRGAVGRYFGQKDTP